MVWLDCTDWGGLIMPPWCAGGDMLWLLCGGLCKWWFDMLECGGDRWFEYWLIDAGMDCCRG